MSLQQQRESILSSHPIPSHPISYPIVSHPYPPFLPRSDQNSCGLRDLTRAHRRHRSQDGTGKANSDLIDYLTSDGGVSQVSGTFGCKPLEAECMLCVLVSPLHLPRCFYSVSACDFLRLASGRDFILAGLSSWLENLKSHDNGAVLAQIDGCYMTFTS